MTGPEATPAHGATSVRSRQVPEVPRRRDTVVDLSLGITGEDTRLVLSQGPFLTEERLALHRNGWTRVVRQVGGGTK